MSKSYKTFSDWLNDQSESVQKRMEMISGALAWDQALLHSEHVKQLEASHRIKIENGNQPVNEQLLVLVKSLGHKAGCTRNAFSSECSCGVDAAIAAAEQQQDCFSNNPPSHEPVVTRSFDEWFLGEQGKPYDSMYVFAKAAWNAATPQPAVPDGFALDAARYRWLRDKADYMRIPEGSPQVVLTDEFGSIVSISPWAYLHGDKLDEAIDGLLAAAKGE